MITYEQLVEGLNNGDILAIYFHIDGYPHYRKCSIQRKVDTAPSGYQIISIAVHLTDDGLEDVSFLFTFEESYKLFRMGRKGTSTLKQIWCKVIIDKIEKK